jgi:hypothetical protein
MLEFAPQTSRENTVSNKEADVRKKLESINEAVLEDIFRTILRRSGYEEKIHMYIPLSDVVCVDLPEIKSSGTYYPQEHKIELNLPYVISENETEEFAAVTKVAIHEEVHALSKGGLVFDDEAYEVEDHIGFAIERRDEITRAVVQKSFTLFNEGMTELIADDVYEEYIRRTGDRLMYSKQTESGNALLGHTTYHEGRIAVNAIIAQIAADIGVSKDVVREGFVALYMSGAGIESVASDIRAATKIDLIKELKDLSPEETMRRVSGLSEGVLSQLLFNYSKRTLAH